MSFREVGYVAELWRYPVKSMRGEPCSSFVLDMPGVADDRRFAVTSSRAPAGKPLLAGDERSAMLLYQPRLAADGSVLVVTPDRMAFDLRDPALLQRIEARLPTPTRLELIESARALTDVRPVALHSVQTSQELARMLPEPGQADQRRLRSNIILDLVDGRAFRENDFCGHVLLIGRTVQIRVLERIPRCRIVSLHPETALADSQLLKHVALHHQGRAGIYAKVLVPGPIGVGDPVYLVPDDEGDTGP